MILEKYQNNISLQKIAYKQILPIAYDDILPDEWTYTAKKILF